LGYCERGEQRQRDWDHTLPPERTSCCTIAIGALLLTAGHWALVEAAKFDPQLSRGYSRRNIRENFLPVIHKTT